MAPWVRSHSRIALSHGFECERTGHARLWHQWRRRAIVLTGQRDEPQIGGFCERGCREEDLSVCFDGSSGNSADCGPCAGRCRRVSVSISIEAGSIDRPISGRRGRGRHSAGHRGRSHRATGAVGVYRLSERRERQYRNGVCRKRACRRLHDDNRDIEHVGSQPDDLQGVIRRR